MTKGGQKSQKNDDVFYDEKFSYRFFISSEDPLKKLEITYELNQRQRHMCRKI